MGGSAYAAPSMSNPHEFVTVFIRNIGEAEDLRAQAEKDLAAAGVDKEAAILASSTRFAAALRAQAESLNSFHLPPPMEGAPQKFAILLHQKAGLFETYIAVAEALKGTPNAGAFYEKLGDKSPDLRGMIEVADETLMKATPLVFGTLVSMTPDAEGYVSRLNITRAERASLIHDLDAAFGEKLEAKNQNYIVSAAAMLRGHLRQPFKCSDEP
ncbi:MAG: hypothetical protein ACYCZX_20885 [Rhodospirillaceae bacterium]